MEIRDRRSAEIFILAVGSSSGVEDQRRGISHRGRDRGGFEHEREGGIPSSELANGCSVLLAAHLKVFFSPRSRPRQQQ